MKVNLIPPYDRADLKELLLPKEQREAELTKAASLKKSLSFLQRERCEYRSVFKTSDPKHPGVELVLAQAEYNLAGKVKVLSEGGFSEKYGAFYMTPRQTRSAF